MPPTELCVHCPTQNQILSDLNIIDVAKEEFCQKTGCFKI